MTLRRITTVVLLFASFASLAFAVPPGSQYVPSDEMLDPNCAPGDANCSVDISTHGTNGLSDIADYQLGLGGALTQNTFIDTSSNVLTIGDSNPASTYDLNVNGEFKFTNATSPTDSISMESNGDLFGYGLSGFGISANDSTSMLSRYLLMPDNDTLTLGQRDLASFNSSSLFFQKGAGMMKVTMSIADLVDGETFGTIAQEDSVMVYAKNTASAVPESNLNITKDALYLGHLLAAPISATDYDYSAINIDDSGISMVVDNDNLSSSINPSGMALGLKNSPTSQFYVANPTETIFQIASDLAAGQSTANFAGIVNIAADDVKPLSVVSTAVVGHALFDFQNGVVFTTQNDQPLTVNGLSGNCKFDTSLATTSCTSDERLKEHVATIDNALELVDQLRGVTFDWKRTSDDNGNKVYGFIAQEVEKVIPEIVSKPSAGSQYYSLSKELLIPVLVNAIKELHTEVRNIQNSLYADTRSYVESVLRNVENKISELFVGTVHTDVLCVGSTCINESQLQEILRGQNNTQIQDSDINVTEEGEYSNQDPLDDVSISGNNDQVGDIEPFESSSDSGSNL